MDYAISCPRSTQSKETRRLSCAGPRRRSNHRRTRPPCRALFLTLWPRATCRLIGELPIHWAPPETSPDPLYKEHSHCKAHVELLGPTGLVASSKIRLGLYGMLADSEYGIRTHPAEETYIMLAGSAFWKCGDTPYRRLFTGERSHHPSMVPHATRTGDAAFMSIYIWDGDISTENYRYYGTTED